MHSASDAARAEKLSRGRARMLHLFAVLLLTQQTAYFSGGVGSSDRSVDHVHIAAWLVMSVAILIALATGGGWIYPRAVRQMANDEATRAHRDDAFRWGFLFSMASCVGLYAASLFEPIGGRDALHLVMTFGIVAALVRFGALERRANRGA